VDAVLARGLRRGIALIGHEDRHISGIEAGTGSCDEETAFSFRPNAHIPEICSDQPLSKEAIPNPFELLIQHSSHPGVAAGWFCSRRDICMPLEARGVFDDTGEGTLMRGEPGRVSPEASQIAKTWRARPVIRLRKEVLDEPDADIPHPVEPGDV
jgi:hypothetical protein